MTDLPINNDPRTNPYLSTKWCVHVIGPDDLIPCEDFRDAVKMAADQNNLSLYQFARIADQNCPLMWGNIERWPYSDKDHAESLAERLGREAKEAQ